MKAVTDSIPSHVKMKVEEQIQSDRPKRASELTFLVVDFVTMYYVFNKHFAYFLQIFENEAIFLAPVFGPKYQIPDFGCLERCR